IIGDDCFDDGPKNRGPLRCLQHLIARRPGTSAKPASAAAQTLHGRLAKLGERSGKRFAVAPSIPCSSTVTALLKGVRRRSHVAPRWHATCFVSARRTALGRAARGVIDAIADADVLNRRFG